MTRYRNVTFSPPAEGDGPGLLHGEQSWGETIGRTDSWMTFTASVDLAWIHDALDTPAGDAIWDMQDGYGEPGFNAGDWSGIRDSSPGCVEEMWAVARVAVPAAEFFGRRGIPVPLAYQQMEDA